MKNNQIFALVLVLVLLVLCYALVYIACATGRQLVGFWSSPRGALFEISPARRGYVLTTASGYLGAVDGTAYPVKMRGCRSIQLALPKGTLRGKIGFDKRRILWRHAPVWHRQGV